MLLLVASVVIFIYGMLASILGTIVPTLASQLALTNAQIGSLALAQGIGLAATSVGAGVLMDRSGKKIGIVIGLFATIVGLLTLAHAATLTPALIAMAILGCGGSLVIVGANAIAAEVPDEKKGTTLNMLNVFVGLGGLVTPFVAGNLFGANPVRISYFGIAIAVSALVFTLVTKMPQTVLVPSGARDLGVFHDSMLYVLSTVTFLYTACEFAMWNWLPKYLVGTGMPKATALNILSLGFACGMLVGRLAAARVLVKAAPLPVTVLSALFMGTSSLVMLYVRTTSAIALAVFVVGLSMAPVFPTTIALVSRHFKQRATTAIGFAITCGFSGLVASSPIIGWMSGSTSAGVHRGLMVVPVLAYAIAMVLLLFRENINRTPNRHIQVAHAL